jgi:hypothetical protein
MIDLLVSISGGRSSATMSRIIQTSQKYDQYNKVYVFANTGMERPETIEFLMNIEKHWGISIIKIEGVYSNIPGVGVKHKIVEWSELDMAGKTFDGAVMQVNKGLYNGLPNSSAPYCSEYLKKRPINHFARTYLQKNYITAIGYRKEDMPRRICWPEIKEDKKRIYPLITDFKFPIGKYQLNEWWKNQPFKLEIDSKFGNCELCWKKSNNNLIESIRKGTRFIEWMQKNEIKYQNTMFRNKNSINDLVKMANQPTTLKIDFGDEFDSQCICSI